MVVVLVYVFFCLPLAVSGKPKILGCLDVLSVSVIVFHGVCVLWGVGEFAHNIVFLLCSVFGLGCHSYVEPTGEGVRCDSGISEGLPIR